METDQQREDRYFRVIAKALQVCAKYKPMFGQGRKGGLSLEQFQRLYQSDPFYAWMGMDSPLMYAAHKAAGGMTSIYRQLGIGCQWVFTEVLRDSLRLSLEQASWNYEVPTLAGKPRVLTLDGRISFDAIEDPAAKARVQQWVHAAADKVLVAPAMKAQLRGTPFKVDWQAVLAINQMGWK